MLSLTWSHVNHALQTHVCMFQVLASQTNSLNTLPLPEGKVKAPWQVSTSCHLVSPTIGTFMQANPSCKYDKRGKRIVCNPCATTGSTAKNRIAPPHIFLRHIGIKTHEWPQVCFLIYSDDLCIPITSYHMLCPADLFCSHTTVGHNDPSNPSVIPWVRLFSCMQQNFTAGVKCSSR